LEIEGSVKMDFTRKVKLGRLAISLLLLVVITLTGTVLAIAYVVLQWTATATVTANPSVCFVKWEDNTKHNTFSYAVNIFPSIKTLDENITYGVWNWAAEQRTAYIRWSSLTNPSNIASLNLTIYNATATVYSQYWSSVPTFPTPWSSFNTAPNTKYAMLVIIEAAADAAVGSSSTFMFELMVEES
jgi:hypothetical protein